MERINDLIIESMRGGGVAPATIERYQQEVITDNLESIGYYWTQHIAALNVNIREHADLCLLLRDTQSEVLWLNTFRERVIPILRGYDVINLNHHRVTAF